MRILGIDPGTRVVGYGVIECSGRRYGALEYGVIAVPKRLGYPERLKHIHDEIGKVIERAHPEAMAIEKVYYGKSAQSAIKIGEGRAVAMLCAAAHGLRVSEYAATEVKKATVGMGGADKFQVAHMVKALLRLSGDAPAADAADALALAICHAHRVAR